MARGGYQIISLKGENLKVGVNTTIKGLHDKIEGSYCKPLLLSDIVIDGKEYNDLYVSYVASNGVFSIKGVYGYTITISDADAVAITAE